MTRDPVADTGYQRGEPSYNRVMWALFAAGFATFVQVFDAQAALPSIARSFGVSPSTASLAVSATALGLAASVLPWASVSDRIGRAPAIRISLLTATLVALLVPLMPTFETAILARGLVGLALGAVPAVGGMYLIEEIAPRWVAGAMGTFIAGNTVGGVVGRLIAGPLSAVIDWRIGLLASTIVGGVAAALFWRIAPAPRGFDRHAQGPHGVLTKVLFQLRDPVMLGLFAQGFFIMGAFAAVYSYFSLHLSEPSFGVPQSIVSLLFLAYLFGTVASSVVGRLAMRFGRLPVILSGLGVVCLGLVLLLADNLIVLIVGLIVFTIGIFTAHPTASGWVGQRALIGRSQATAIYQLCWLAGTALFAWLVGRVFDVAAWPGLVVAVLIMCALSALALLTGVVVLGQRRPDVPRR